MKDRYCNTVNMERFLVVLLHTNVFLITCFVSSHVLNPKGPKSTHITPLISHPWFHASDMRNIKILREGLASEGSGLEPTTDHPQTKHDCVCSKIYDPVCASNNESYFNLCFLECKEPNSHNISVVHQGNCIPFRR